MKKETALCYAFLFLSFFSASALESVLRIGGEEGFRSMGISSQIRVRALPEGGKELTLQDQRQAIDSSTDLYLTFDQPPVRDQVGAWRVRESNVEITPNIRARGAGAGAFLPRSRIVLVSEKETFFSGGVFDGGFTIDFWLYPSTLSEGETIFVYRKPPSATVDYQEIACRVSGRTLAWSFLNVFQGPRGKRIDVLVRGTTPLVPREWRHHLLRYDASTGMLEYLLDGEPDAIVYATPSGREEPALFYPSLEKTPRAPLWIGEGYNGLMDEFTVSRQFRESAVLKRFPSLGGWFETTPLDLGYHDSRFVRLSAKQFLVDNAAVFYYYRVANSLAELGKQEWVPLELEKDQGTRARGRYLQLRGELYPDGTGNHAPRISEILLYYELKAPPPPPTYVQAIPGDGEVLLRWSRVPDPSVKGYFVYYGWEPGVFKGNDSSLGSSPLKVGNQTELLLTGLTNGKLYYFSISAYDSSEDPLSSRLSAMVSARPSRIYRNEQRNKSQ